MSDYYTIVTTAGQAKLAAFVAGGDAVNIARLSVGDANGVAYNPVESQVGLTHEVWRTSSVAVAALAGAVISIAATIPANLNDDLGRPSGGFNVLEIGVWDDAGVLIAVAKSPARFKPLPTSGAADDMDIQLLLNIGVAGGVNLAVTTDAMAPISRIPRIGFMSVISATLTAPPGGPVTGDTYLVPAGATGAWAAKVGQLAQYYSGTWVFNDPPLQTIVGVVDTGVYLSRAPSGWVAAAFGAAFASAGGTANAITLTPMPATPAYATGQRLRFKAGAAANTGAATINVGGLGVKAIVRRDGTPLAAGDIPANSICEITYDGANFQLTTGTSVAPATDAVAGIVELATSAEASAMADATRALTPASIAALIATLATLASPALTGNPTAPTQAAGNSSTRLATTAFVQAAIAALVSASPAALDTLNELAAALGNDPNFATTVTNALAAKAPLNSPALTGAPTAPTAAGGTNNTQIATTAFVQAVAAALAPKASPALTGNPTAPTPATADNDTSIATTAHVWAAINSFAKSLGTGGASSSYVTLPGGLMVQFFFVGGVSGAQTITFPWAFPAGPLAAFIQNAGGDEANTSMGVDGITSTGFTLGVSGTAPGSIYVLAFGK